MLSSDLICVGLNHAHTPVELREQVVFSKNNLGDALKEAIREEGIEEAAILSTCHRIEIYAQGSIQKGPAALESFLHRYHDIPHQLLTPHLYQLNGYEVLHQLMRVTSSLDSLVVGEPQILGQVKEAYAQAREYGAIGPSLTRAFSQAFLTAKRVRTETELGKNAVTIAYAAVQLAQKVFGNLKNLEGLLLGGGEMGSLAASHFRQKGALVQVANRSSDWIALLSKVDFVVTSTTATYFLITPQDLKKVIRFRRYKPLFLIDISVPRNIDPKVTELDNVYLYNIDDLSQVVAANLEERQAEVYRAEGIILEEMEAFRVEAIERQLAPVIQDFQTQTLLIAAQEFEKFKLSESLDSEQAKALEIFTRQLTAKIFHQGVLALKQMKRLSG